MRIQIRQALLLTVIGLALAGCGTTNLLGDPQAKADASGDEQQVKADAAGTDALASADGGLPEPSGKPSLLGQDPTDDLNEGKKQYRAGNFGVAENHFRHAVEMHPRDAEAWLGLAASCDRLRRFDLADRAYAQAIKIIGPVPEILNNQGYSYMLRGDYKRARKVLATAEHKDPSNKFVQSNLRLLEESERTGKAIE
jgi:Flp pilus assembly protein TadD